MDHRAPFSRASSLHRDASASQSLSQARPRRAIRLEASLSFLNGNSRCGSPRSGPASPTLVALTSQLFAPKDVNAKESGKPSLSKSQQQRSRRDVSGSLRGTSLSLSLGSSRHPSQRPHGQPQPPPYVSSHARGLDSSAAPFSHSRSRRGAQTPSPPLAMLDALLDSEPTQMETPFDLPVDYTTRDVGRPEGADGVQLVHEEEEEGERPRSRQLSTSEQRATSPAPRMAVTLHDSFNGSFSESCSVLPSLRVSSLPPTAPAATSAAAAARPRNVSPVVSAEAVHDSASGFSSFSFSRDGRVTREDHTAEMKEDAKAGDDDLAVERSRTWSTTPPPRRAFVLSRRCSGDSTTLDNHDYEDAENADENINAEEVTIAAGKTESEGEEAAVARVSEILVMGSGGSGNLHGGFFRLQRQRGLGEQRHGPPRRSEEKEEEEEEEEGTGTLTAKTTNVHKAAHSSLPDKGKVAAPAAPEVAEEGERRTAVDATAVSVFAATTVTIASVAAHPEDTSASLYPYRHSTGLRLSEYLGGTSSSSGRSSMMSPLPRPVTSTVDSVAEIKAARLLSPAHAREEAAEMAGDSLNDVATADGTAEQGGEGGKARAEAGASKVEKNGAVSTVQPSPQRSRTPVAAESSLPITTPTATTTDTRALLEEEPTNTSPTAAVEAAFHAPRATESALEPQQWEATTEGDKTEASFTATPTTVTSTTALAAVSSLWLVSGSTPTPLRRLRGEVAESGEATLLTAAAAAADEQRETHQSSLSVPLTFSHGVSPVPPSPPSPPEEEGAAGAEEAHEDVAPVLSPQFSAGSCSPEPQRPVVSPAFEDRKEVKVFISPVLPERREVQRQGPRLEVNEASTAPAPRERPAANAHSARPSIVAEHVPSLNVTSPFRSAYTATATATTATPPSPSSFRSSESARVSEEVRELVERAQAEVRRTRASLLATLRERRADFNLSDTSTTTATTTTAATVDVTPSATPTRALLLPEVGVRTAEMYTPSSDVTNWQRTRSSGELRSAALMLRRHLVEAADAVYRRLQGYDTRGHGVLPMETVVRVTYFVVARRTMPLTTWTLRTAEGAVATTPMRASMGGSREGAVGQSQKVSVTPSHHATPRCDGAREHNFSDPHCTPREQRCTLAGGATTTSRRKRSRSGPREGDITTTTRCSFAATCMSPSRTLEQVMAHQRRRAEEAQYLNFYLTVLEAFKQVFGERYAWRHLGATNASRHDSAMPKQQCAMVERGHTAAAAASSRRKASSDETISGESKPAQRSDVGVAAPLDIRNELDDVEGPLETVFPRLRQQYALRQGEGTAATGDVSALHPPPLDVLVYYRTFTTSLREL